MRGISRIVYLSVLASAAGILMVNAQDPEKICQIGEVGDAYC
jgi:hypothetical protein